MNQSLLAPCLALLGVIAAAPIAAAQDPATTPKITSISKITTAEHQTITITGTGFGTHKAYTGNSKFISFDDQTKAWEAGYQPDGDTVTLIVNSWTATKIVLGGFAGKWGTSNFTLAAGNKEFIRLWNAQSAGGTLGLTCGTGCVSKTVTVVKASTSAEIRSSKKTTVYGEPVTFRAIVTSSGGVPPDGELVSFMRGEEVLGTGILKGGVARFTTSALEFGITSVRAVYGGDSDFERTSRDDESASLKHTVE